MVVQVDDGKPRIKADASTVEQLTKLQSLILTYTDFTGHLKVGPDMRVITSIGLPFTQFSVSPSQSRLVEVTMVDGELEGKVPTELLNDSDMQQLVLRNNSLTSIDQTFGSTLLRILDLSHNQIVVSARLLAPPRLTPSRGSAGSAKHVRRGSAAGARWRPTCCACLLCCDPRAQAGSGRRGQLRVSNFVGERGRVSPSGQTWHPARPHRASAAPPFRPRCAITRCHASRLRMHLGDRRRTPAVRTAPRLSDVWQRQAPTQRARFCAGPAAAVSGHPARAAVCHGVPQQVLGADRRVLAKDRGRQHRALL